MSDGSRARDSSGDTLQPFPKSFVLNGSDVFMLAMDYDMRRHGSVGNICHLLVSFAPNTRLEELHKQLVSSPLFLYASGLRLSTRFMRAPRWRWIQSEPSHLGQIQTVTSEQDLHDWISSHKIDIWQNAPIGVAMLPSYHRGPSLIFFWHHSLCDAHGGERFVQALAAGSDGLPVVPQKNSPENLRAFFTQVKRAKKTVFAKAGGAIARLCLQTQAGCQRRYSKLRFSDTETARIDQVSTQLTSGMFSTAMYLAATARAYAEISGTTLPLFIPVPHDMRRYTQARALLSNQLSFIFFRFLSGQLRSLADATAIAIEQLHEAIVSEAPRDQVAFLQLIKRLPTGLLWRVIEVPAAGHPASLYVSDIGKSLNSLDHVCGEKVEYATHYPPQVSPPGLTVVWSRYRDQLELTICYDEACISQEQIRSFVATIRRDLTLNTTDATNETQH